LKTRDLKRRIANLYVVFAGRLGAKKVTSAALDRIIEENNNARKAHIGLPGVAFYTKNNLLGTASRACGGTL
jgi:hypothetical protein